MNKLLNKLFHYKAMVGKGSPRFNMSSSPKVCRYMPTTNASKKKPSPKCSGAKKSGGSPKGMVFNIFSCFLVSFLLLML
jgi:hypothetical protein